MKLLDLFCCCGGISKGFHDAGFECTGVDIKDGHQYPYEFILSDVFDLKKSFFEEFDLIHASPPCQYYIHTNKYRKTDYPDLLPKTRELLLKTGKPFILENVVGAPLRKDLILCGEMFGLRVIRHRIFEVNGFTVLQPFHVKHKLSVMNGTAIAVYSGGVNPGFFGDKQKQKEYRQFRKTLKKPTLEDKKQAMGIDWIDDEKHLTQMIPPKYSEYIAKFILVHKHMITN